MAVTDHKPWRVGWNSTVDWELELNVRFSLQFEQPCILLNLFKWVQTHLNWYNSWCWICEFHGVMAIGNFFFLLLTYHQHNFLTPVWLQPIENGKPGLRQKQPDAIKHIIRFCVYPGTIFLIMKTLEPSTIPHTWCTYGAHIMGPIPITKTIGETRIQLFLYCLCTGQWNIAW
jgi:hypothetical protein